LQTIEQSFATWVRKLLTSPVETNGSVSRSAIQEQLDRILAYPPFQNSRRYPKFLKFIVEKALSGTTGEIKERVIGIEVFARPLGYEPASDPVVRLVAGEIRKRLAQYYIQEDHENELRVEIPPGSYVPVFRWPQHPPAAARATVEPPQIMPGEPAAPAPASGEAVKVEPHADSARHLSESVGRSRYRMWAGVAAATLLLIAGSALAQWWIGSRPSRLLNAFWKPILTNRDSTLICIGDWENTVPNSGDTFNRIHPGTDYVGPYDLGALGELVGALGGKERPLSILLANEATLTDLRAEPGILIGAYNNRWTPMVLTGLRFQFRSDAAANVNYLFDTQNPQKRNWVLDSKTANLSTMSVTQDVGVISRIVSSATGQVELVIAGVGRCGTIAASEFVTSPEYFKQFASQAPRGWESRNVQIVVSTNVINARSGPPHMVLFDIR
jgi:hypothetical protein